MVNRFGYEQCEYSEYIQKAVYAWRFSPIFTFFNMTCTGHGPRGVHGSASDPPECISHNRASHWALCPVHADNGAARGSEPPGPLNTWLHGRAVGSGEAGQGSLDGAEARAWWNELVSNRSGALMLCTGLASAARPPVAIGTSGMWRHRL